MKLNQLKLANRQLIFPRSKLPLHAMLTGGGYHHMRDTPYDYHGLKRGPKESVALQYTTDGRGRLRFEKSDFEVLPGTLMILNFPHNHRYWLSRGAYWNFFYLSLEGSEAVRIWREVISNVGPLIRCKWNSSLIQGAARTCLDITSNKIKTPWHASAVAYQVAMSLLEFSEGLNTQTRPKRSKAIEKAIAFCQGKIDEPFGLDDMAAAAGYSRHHFSRMFKESEGIAPMKYIVRERLKRACLLLFNTEEPISIVSEKCGFNDPNYFIRSFRKRYGITPLAARQQRKYY